MIKSHPVNSSNIDRAGYDKENRTLEIKFKNGSVYRYEDVPEIMYTDIFRSKSPGAFVQRWIVKGQYKNSKVNKNKEKEL